jgi:HK97 family phage major capsid protein
MDGGSIPTELKEVIDDQLTAWEEYKKANDAILDEIKKTGAADVVARDKLEKIEKAFDKSEKANQDLVRKIEAEKAKAEAEKDAADKEEAELKERLDKMETALRRPSAGSDEDQKAQKHQRRENWVRGVIKSELRGSLHVTAEEKEVIDQVTQEIKDLSVGDDTTGGFLAPHEYVMEILKGVVEFSPFRTVARVRTTSRRALVIPKRTQTGGAGWTSELGTRSETQNPTFGMEEIPTHEMYAMIDISEQNLEDTVFNLEQFVREESTEQFAVLEGASFIDGNAVGKPEGILTNSSIGSTDSGSASTIADTDGNADGFITLYHALKTAYARNATWLMNRVTLGSIRKLKDANEQYIWVPGLASLRPNTILDAPYVEMPDMPNEAADAFPVAFGDFRRGYIVVDRVSMSMLRDPFTQAASGLIRFWFRRRVGGQVVIPEAMRKLKCSS